MPTPCPAGATDIFLFVELCTLLATIAVAVQVVRARGDDGALLVGALLWLGFVRETVVAAREILYGFADLSLMVGLAPLISAIIWFFSIVAAVVFAEVVSGERLPGSNRVELPVGEGVSPSAAPRIARLPSLRFLLLVGLFMVALAIFYEPVLALLGMARWEDGTRETLGVPWIALVGYTTMALGFLAVWCVVQPLATFRRRLLALAVAMPALAAAHALGLFALKRGLGW